MMEFFLKHRLVIMRSLGAIMLLIGFAVHFWVTPKEGLSENDKAAARVARMEASAKEKTLSKAGSQQNDTSKFMDKIKNAQAKQLQYMTIIVMVLGVGFLGYSFMPKKV